FDLGARTIAELVGGAHADLVIPFDVSDAAQGFADESDFSFEVGTVIEVMQLTASARAEIHAGWRSEQRSWVHYSFNHAAGVVALALDNPHPHKIAGCGMRHEDGLRADVRQSVAAIDQLLNCDLIELTDRHRSGVVFF